MSDIIEPAVFCGVCDKPYRMDIDLLSGKTIHLVPKGCRHGAANAVMICPRCGEQFTADGHTCSEDAP